MEEQMLQWLLGMLGNTGVLIASGVGALVVVAECVVALTPSTSDDEAWAKIKAIPVLGALIAAVAKLAPIQKKPKE